MKTFKDIPYLSIFHIPRANLPMVLNAFHFTIDGLLL